MSEIVKKRFRHELKYFINHPEAMMLALRLEKLLKRDENAGASGEYMIRSLYFDDYVQSAYKEKEMGVYARRKYRIRIYNCSDAVIRLERKTKEDQYIFKESARLTREQTERILDGDYAFLEKSEQSLLREFYYECTTRVMRPRVITDYDREPFVMESGDVRITLDKHVRAASGKDIFNPELPTLDVVTGDRHILEVKYTAFLPRQVRDILPLRTAQQTAASKFLMCCDACPDGTHMMDRPEVLLWTRR